MKVGLIFDISYLEDETAFITVYTYTGDDEKTYQTRNDRALSLSARKLRLPTVFIQTDLVNPTLSSMNYGVYIYLS